MFAEDEAAILRNTAKTPGALEGLTQRRIAGEPLEYVVGYADFAGVRVRLDPGVFIPRQRTTFLVDLAAGLAPTNSTGLDLCCGSGALGLALANRRPDLEVHAADLDPRAVACARRNLPAVYQSDLFAHLPEQLRGRMNLVLANVPYVPTAELDRMPVEARDHEPRPTHDGGADGLDLLRRVLHDAPSWVAPAALILFEIATDQADAVARTCDDVRFEHSDEYDTTVAIATVRH